MKSPTTPSGRCETRAGEFQCDYSAGHSGPCETTQPATTWAGPALAPRDLSAAVARAVGLASKEKTQ